MHVAFGRVRRRIALLQTQDYVPPSINVSIYSKTDDYLVIAGARILGEIPKQKHPRQRWSGFRSLINCPFIFRFYHKLEFDCCQSAFFNRGCFYFWLGISKQIRNAAHEPDPIPIQTVLISRLAVYSNWNYPHPHQLLLDYLY